MADEHAGEMSSDRPGSFLNLLMKGGDAEGSDGASGEQRPQKPQRPKLRMAQMLVSHSKRRRGGATLSDPSPVGQHWVEAGNGCVKPRAGGTKPEPKAFPKGKGTPSHKTKRSFNNSLQKAKRLGDALTVKTEGVEADAHDAGGASADGVLLKGRTVAEGAAAMEAAMLWARPAKAARGEEASSVGQDSHVKGKGKRRGSRGLGKGRKLSDFAANSAQGGGDVVQPPTKRAKPTRAPSLGLLTAEAPPWRAKPGRRALEEGGPPQPPKGPPPLHLLRNMKLKKWGAKGLKIPKPPPAAWAARSSVAGQLAPPPISGTAGPPPPPPPDLSSPAAVGLPPPPPVGIDRHPRGARQPGAPPPPPPASGPPPPGPPAPLPQRAVHAYVPSNLRARSQPGPPQLPAPRAPVAPHRPGPSRGRSPGVRPGHAWGPHATGRPPPPGFAPAPRPSGSPPPPGPPPGPSPGVRPGHAWGPHAAGQPPPPSPAPAPRLPGWSWGAGTRATTAPQRPPPGPPPPPPLDVKGGKVLGSSGRSKGGKGHKGPPHPGGKGCPAAGTPPPPPPNHPSKGFGRKGR